MITYTLSPSLSYFSSSPLVLPLPPKSTMCAGIVVSGPASEGTQPESGGYCSFLRMRITFSGSSSIQLSYI